MKFMSQVFFNKKNQEALADAFLSKYIYTVYKRLRLFSLICFLSLSSNLVGNLIWTFMEEKQAVSLASEEDDDSEERDSDTDENNNGSSKRGINLLEEELHLAENTSLSSFEIDFNLLQKSSFSILRDKTNGSEKVPLDNPPEIG
ncbi:hypothetical protein [uncultured Fluviicola sp.]|uniref:hypothetical protein n=1 Tax=uncultured Fluviicola sp. TaxID=463303 RepID=UPI0025DEFD63|nr:hypothetical protein [uncultured Fluviicola sp.]